MAKPNPTFAGPELIEIEVDQFNRVAMERKKDMKMEMEMLARERDLLRKEVSLSEKMQKYLELQKCGVEEKLERSNKRCEELEENLGRSERRCEELEAKVNKLRQSRSRRKCEELRRKEIEAESRSGLIRISDHSGGDGGIFSEKEPRNEETTVAQVLNVNHAGKSIAAAATAEETPNVPESDENGKQKVNVGDGDGDAISLEVCGTSDKPGGNRGIELSTEGNRELFHGGTQEDGTKVDFTRPVSKPSYISEVAESQGSVQDNDGKRPEAEVTGQSKKDNQGETPQEVKEGGQREPDNQGKNSHEVEEGGSNKEEQGQVCDAAKPSPSTAAGEVITTSDDEDDVGYENRRKRKRSEEAQQASAPAL